MQMSGFRNHSPDAQVWRYQRTGSRAVSLEVRGSWLPEWCPVQTNSSLPGRELRTASGVDNEKTEKKDLP